MKNHAKIQYKNARAVVLWLQNGICYNCSCKAISPEVHHLDHDSTNNDLQNLAVLCHSCHKLFHRIPKQPKIIAKRFVFWLLQKVEIFSRKQ